MNNALLSIRGVSKKYEGMYALKGIDMDLEPGTVRALVGENGAGKSDTEPVMAWASA
jgi:ABC-type sugar transport system ATPase subunit